MEAAKQNRKAARIWVTRLSNKLCEAVSNGSPCSAIEPILAEFRERVDRLDSAQESLESLIDEDQLESLIEEADEYQDMRVRPVLAKVSDYLSAHQPVVESDSESVTSSPSARSTGHAEAKLPKITLPDFFGDFAEYESWWDLFDANVHNTDKPPVTKFSYLKSLVKGDAGLVIKGLKLTAANYPVAISLLQKRYGRPDRVIFEHINELLSIKSVSDPSVTQLYTLLDYIQSRVRSLDSMGITGAQYGVILTPLILSRLPPSLRLQWVRESEIEEASRAASSSPGTVASSPGVDASSASSASKPPVGADLAFLLQFLENEIGRREMSTVYTGMRSGQLDAPPTSASAAVLHSGTKAKPTGCGVCPKKHPTAECPKLTSVSVSKRRELLKRHNVCMKCLTRSTKDHHHDFLECKSKCAQCQKSHHMLICTPPSPPASTQSDNTVKKASALSCSSSTLISDSASNTSVLFQTVSVKVQGPNGREAKANILFDSGADRTYISKNLVDKIRPEYIESNVLSFAAFGAEAPTNAVKRDVYSVCLGGECVRATCVPHICAPIYQPSIPTSLLKLMPEIIEAKAGDTLKIDVLVGMDCYWRLMTGTTKFLTPDLAAQKSKLGWVVSGNVPASAADPQATKSQPQVSLFCQGMTPEANFWSLDAIGISEKEMEPEENLVLDIEKSSERYVVGLPWKYEYKQALMDNKSMAIKRLSALSARLERDEDLKTSYDAVFREMLAQDIIEDVPDEPLNAGSAVYYMPHHPVVKKSSTTTKVRPVFDASSKGYNGISLNDCMYSGPNLLPELPGLLLRFRRWKFALSADITKAFLQVGVKEHDRDVHRFVWNDHGTTRVMRFTRVPFGNKASPYLLMATIKHHLSQQPQSHVVSELEQNLYMDDWLSGCDQEETVVSMFNEANQLMSSAGMTFAKWGSNHINLSERFGTPLNPTGTHKVLGMKWVPGADVFAFDGLDTSDTLCLTKRVVLSLISRLFDPLGLLHPFTIRAKIQFQELWREGYEWDMLLNDEYASEFRKWLQELTELRQWTIPRRYLTCSLWSENPRLSLHGFGDASPQAYGACVYLVSQTDTGYESSLVMARARVAPLKQNSLPRLELLGSLLVARLIKYVKNALGLEQVTCHCWTDSMVALAWIQGDPIRWKTFVANRVSEIQKLTDRNLWRHCPGVANPADHMTRGLSASELMTSQNWLHGPIDLISRVENASENKSENASVVKLPFSEEDAQTVAREQRPSHSLSVQTPTVPFFDVTRHSSFTKAMRVMAYVLRFCSCVRGKRTVGDLSFDELTEAKFALLKVTQSAAYGKELNALQGGSPIPNSSSIKKLSPFLGEYGLLRVEGRLQFADLPDETRHPVIIPKGHMATLLARHVHLAKKHAGVNSMLVDLRNAYWIVGARRICKAVTRNCKACQRFDAKPLNQPMAPLPKDRVKRASPFATSGIDHAGPLYCKDQPGKKFYILLFTCAVTRAVHLELVESMSCEDTVLALRRFFARRGMATTLVSDNAKGFVAAKDKMLELYGTEGPEWHCIVPRAPWWGGFYERLVGVVKSSLKKSIGRGNYNRVELETILHEVEGCVNSRPLTFVGDEIQASHPLTPSSFLIGRDSVLSKAESGKDSNLEEMYEMRAEVMNEFWAVWRDEYIKNLPPYRGNTHGKEVKIGSVVLIEGEGRRLDWPLGLITKVHEGKDGLIRAVTLKTQKGLIQRPIQRLRDLEVYALASLQEPIDSTSTPSFSPPLVPTQDPHSNPDNGTQARTVTIPQPTTTRSGRVIKKPMQPGFIYDSDT